MLKRAEQTKDIVKLNAEVGSIGEEGFISEADYLARMAELCINSISDTVMVSKNMLNELESERIAIPMKSMFDQFSTKICEAFAEF